MIKLNKFLIACLCLGVASLATTPVHAAKKKKAKTTRTAKPKMDQGSGETTKERERRLLRECRGRPNAGACEGFTRG
ncbi:MAG: hypothetical protein IPF65_12940 [Polaromonas sp.]|jgi:hypothetical protein|nr:hypothetical protein [Polaromonas sp.]MBK9340351.1 hypothetical protein [Rhodoferax sp.]MBK7025766.1 hypothetical protein [Polaromonas sp.]MBK7501729.1 hypothetical protein [Polaromonas sp.]MBL0253427.1 hypothetical protein [Polaromonas sp.]